MKPSNKYAAHTQHHFGVNFNSIGSAVPELEICLKTRDIPKIVPSFPFKCYRKYFIVRSDKLCHISNSTASISTGQKALCMGIRAECSCHRNNASAIKQKILPVSLHMAYFSSLAVRSTKRISRLYLCCLYACSKVQ